MVVRPGIRRLARIAAQWVIGAASLAAGSMVRPSRGVRPVPGSILIIRLDLLGDVLFSLQAAEGLRRVYPQAHIVFVALPYTAPLARLCPAIDEVIEVDTNRIRTIRGLVSPRTWAAYWHSYRYVRRRKFELAVSLCGRTASFVALLSGARRRIGYAAESYPRALTEPVQGGRYRQRIPEVDYVRNLALAAGAVDFPSRLTLPVPADSNYRADTLLRSHGLDTGVPFVVVHAGSVNGSAKRWPPGHWARFISGLLDQTGLPMVLVGARSDAPIADEVLTDLNADSPLAGGRVVNLVGGTDVEDLIAIIARSELIASGDSGPLHLGVALGRPVLGVYGPTDVRIHGPFNPVGPTRVHRKDLPCSPCYSMATTAECPLGDPICMRLVTVHSMVESAVTLLT